MALEFEIQQGFFKEHRHSASCLYAEAFEKKLYKIIARKEALIPLFELSINPKYAFSAIDNQGLLIGLAGFHIGAKSLLDLKWMDFIHTFGLIKGTFKAILGEMIFYREPHNKKQLLMDGIVVDQNVRGQGIGSALFQSLEQYAIENGFESIRLDVIDENPRAKKLYSTIGFVEKEHTHISKTFQSLVNISGYSTMVKALYQTIQPTP